MSHVWVPRWDDNLLMVTETIDEVFGVPLDDPVEALRLITCRTHAEAVHVAEIWRRDRGGDVGAVWWPETGIDDEMLLYVRQARALPWDEIT